MLAPAGSPEGAARCITPCWVLPSSGWLAGHGRSSGRGRRSGEPLPCRVLTDPGAGLVEAKNFFLSSFLASLEGGAAAKV